MARTRRSLAFWIWGGAGFAVVVFVAWALWPRSQPVESATIDRGLVRVEIADEGRAHVHDIYVIAAPVSGRLNRVEIEPGDHVRSGQLVARISPADPQLLDARMASEAQAATAAARSMLIAAEAQLALATLDQGRVARLAAGGYATPAALDAANLALHAARAGVAARRADVRRAEAAAGNPAAGAARGETLIRAPAAGEVLRLLQESETVLLAGSPILEIGDPSKVEIVADFLSQDAVNLKPGAAATIENWGGEAPLAAVIERVEPYARTKVSALGVEEQRVKVVLALRDAARARALGEGFRVDVRAVVSEYPNSVRAPTDALVRLGAGWSVYLIRGGRARRTAVDVGDGGGRYRVVRSGLSVGDVVILFPREGLADGAPVRPAVR